MLFVEQFNGFEIDYIFIATKKRERTCPIFIWKIIFTVHKFTYL